MAYDMFVKLFYVSQICFCRLFVVLDEFCGIKKMIQLISGIQSV